MSFLYWLCAGSLSVVFGLMILLLFSIVFVEIIRYINNA